MLAVGREDRAARLPEHGPVAPDRVLARIVDVRPPELLLGRVGELHRGVLEIGPGPVRRRGREPGLGEQLLVVDRARLSTSAGTPTILPSTVACWRSAG